MTIDRAGKSLKSTCRIIMHSARRSFHGRAPLRVCGGGSCEPRAVGRRRAGVLTYHSRGRAGFHSREVRGAVRGKTFRQHQGQPLSAMSCVRRRRRRRRIRMNAHDEAEDERLNRGDCGCGGGVRRSARSSRPWLRCRRPAAAGAAAAGQRAEQPTATRLSVRRQPGCHRLQGLAARGNYYLARPLFFFFRIFRLKKQQHLVSSTTSTSALMGALDRSAVAPSSSMPPPRDRSR